MKNQVSHFTEFRKYYLSEYELYDGECFITFNLVGVDLDRSEIQVAVSDRGRISVITYDLMADKNGRLYFEYGVMFERVYLDEFEEAAYHGGTNYYTSLTDLIPSVTKLFTPAGKNRLNANHMYRLVACPA